MGFEPVSIVRLRTSLGPNECSLTGAGMLTMPRALLRRAAIAKRFVLLADAGTRRIALRAPRDGEPHSELSDRGGAVAYVSVRSALRALGIEGAEGRGAARGRYEVAAKDDLLIVGPLMGQGQRGKR